MRKNFRLCSFAAALLIALALSASKVTAAPCGTTVNWHNRSDTGCPGQTDPGITQDVVDQNIDVIGLNALAGGISVRALACDITITVTNGDAIITGSGNRCDGVPSAPAELYLFADFGRTINFNLANSLLFSGSADGAIPLDLLITASGNGVIRFTLGDGQSVSFTPKDAGSGGTFFMEGMSSATPGFVAFQNSLVHTTGSPALVIIGPKSLISFISQTGDATASADLEFQSAGTFTEPGLKIIIQDGGAFNVNAYPGDLTLPNFSIADINFFISAGTSPIVTFRNINGIAGSLVSIINNNTQCPSDLLINPFCIPIIRALDLPGIVSPGFVLVAPSVLTVIDQTYIGYISTATNVCCSFDLLDACGIPEPTERLRNGSAFIVDSPDDATFATINLLGSSAIYFISGVDNCGSVSPDFTVNTSVLSNCAGNIVLDVEGPLNVFGSSPDETGLEILSLQTVAKGCPVTVDSVAPATFPKRTFARQPNGDYIQYNLGAFLINNRMNLFSTSLIHTDTTHKVYEHFNLGNPNIASQPTYIGGDSYLFPCHAGRPRPTMAFYNSDFRVHSSVASTGVDFLFPNNADFNNTSNIIFYNNGFCIDRGYGRNMILGTEICFDDCITTTNIDSHLNVFQENAQAVPTLLTLNLLTDYNTDCITEGIPSQAAIFGQNAVQTIFLNNASNFSIGTNGAVGVDSAGATFDLTVTANVNINGACLSFETRGGTLAFPETVGTTGEGGIFVDKLGAFRLLNRRLASFGTMVTKSRGGIVFLPSNQAFFEPEVGIAEWQPDLADPLQRLLVDSGEHLSDYTFDWGAARKPYCCNDLVTSTACFIPYDIEELPFPCNCPAVTQNNLFDLPTVKGEVEQFQVLRSRMCDTIHLLVDGGFIRELVFLPDLNTAGGPFGFIVIQNDGLVGLGSTHKDVDALFSSIVLGVNGVMLVPNGNANVELNEDIIINNVCHILSGTAFGQNGNVNTLAISSTTPKELRIKSTGVLDLSQFTLPGQIFEITGQVKLVCEPGARIVLGGGTFILSGQSQWFLEPEFDTQVQALPGVNVNSTDDIRVKLSGTGTINMIEGSSMFIPVNAFFGVETYLPCSTVTDINWILNDQASIQIGNAEQPGGSFQVGDTSSGIILRSINFLLELSGQGALFNLNRQGFFGLSAGIVKKNPNENPNMWTVSCLSNVSTCSIIVAGPVGVTRTAGGTFSHNQIASGDQEEASLFAIGSEGDYFFLFNPANSVILGGGNLVKINCTQLEEGEIIPVSVVPTVTTFAGVHTNGFVQSGIMSGKLLLQDRAKAGPVSSTPQGLFNFLNTIDNFSQFSPKANIGNNALNEYTLGYVVGTTINRPNLTEIRGTSGTNVANSTHSLQIGAVNLTLDPVSFGVVRASEIFGTGNGF